MFKHSPSPQRKRSLILLTFISLPIVMLIGWISLDFALHKTSDHHFCSSCHSMKPMQQSFLQDLHGGRSQSGMQALCTDCHLPQDSYSAYLYEKVRSSSADIWIEFVSGTDHINWHEKRKEARRYVYDSGCLKCHNHLYQAAKDNPVLFENHRSYFMGENALQCVDCHRVGHQGLEKYLPPNDS